MRKINQKTHRVFFAIDLDVDVKTDLLNLQHRITNPQLNPVAAENFHITLAFLGEQPDAKIESIMDGITTANCTPFEIEINFPFYLAAPKILAMGVNHGAEKLYELKRFIESEIRKLHHFNIDKKTFKPHISLYRNIDEYPETLPSFERTITVNSFCLMASIPTQKSVRYEMIEQWQLKDSRSIKDQLIG